MVSCILVGVAYAIITKKVYSLSCVAFPVGLYMAYHSIRVSIKTILVGLLLFGGSFTYHLISNNLINTPIRLLNYICLSVTTIPFIYVISFLRLPVKIIGSQSMNYYVMHGLCLRIMSQMDFERKYVYIILYIVMVVVNSFIFGRINKYIVGKTTQCLHVQSR